MKKYNDILRGNNHTVNEYMMQYQLHATVHSNTVRTYNNAVRGYIMYFTGRYNKVNDKSSTVYLY